MKSNLKILGLCVSSFLLFNCGSVKVLDAWQSPEVTSIKKKNVLVLARTSNENARIAFEKHITDKLIARGIKATPSFSKFPPLAAAKDIDEEGEKMIREILEYEGFDAIVITSVKDLRERTVASNNNNYYFADPWNTFYPSYYGNFYGYYYQPYVYSFSIGGASPSVSTSKTYYLETVAFNLEETDNDQLLAIVTTSINDPKDAFKTAERYTDEIFKALDN